MESLNKNFYTNYENNITYFKGDQESIKKFFKEHLEEKLRTELCIEETTKIEITEQGEYDIGCLISYPYNINLTILFHETDICTCGQQYMADRSVNAEKIKNVIDSLVKDYSL